MKLVVGKPFYTEHGDMILCYLASETYQPSLFNPAGYVSHKSFGGL